MRALIILIAVLWVGSAAAEPPGKLGIYTCTKETCPLVFTAPKCPDAGKDICEMQIHIEPGYTVRYHGVDVRCLDTMEAAMRAMEPWLKEHPSKRPQSSGGSNIYYGDLVYHCTKDTCPWVFIDPPESLEEKLARVAREHAREQEQAGQKIVDEALELYAYAQWTEAKACWSKP